jgi:hypothetical protein
MRILSQVGHLMSVETAGRATARLLSERESIENQTPLWARAEDVWLSAIAALLPSVPPNLQTLVSEALYALASQSNNPLILQGMDAALTALQWDRLGKHDQSKWLAFAAEHLGQASHAQFVAVAVMRGLAHLRPNEVNRLVLTAYRQTRSLLHGALVLDLHPRPPRAFLLSLAEGVLAAVAQTRADAAAGRYSMGTVRTGSMLASLALRLRKRHVWEAVTELITDGRAPSEMRADALTTLSRASAHVPKYALRRLQNASVDLQNPPPFDEREALSGSWLRFRATHGIAPEQDLLSDFLDLASAPTARARMEAAASLESLLGRIGAEALATAMLMLSRDANPHVRAAATRSLPLLAHENSAVGRRVRDRVEQMLMDTGDEAPLAALQGLSHDDRLLGEPAVHAKVALMASRHASRTIRQAAARLIG